MVRESRGSARAKSGGRARWGSCALRVVGLITITSHYKPQTSGRAWEVHVALLGLGIKSDVGAGENAGRLLEHNFVVLAFERVVMDAVKDGFSATVTLSRKKNTAERLAVATWVTSGNSPAPVQADRRLFT